MNSAYLSRLLGGAICLWAWQARAEIAEPTEDGAASPDAQDSAPTAPEGASSPHRAPDVPASTAPVGDNWRVSLYGFAELDGMRDTTQSYGPASNNTKLARPGTYAGAHTRSQITVNNSQLGVRIAAPDYGRIKTTGRVEVDFFGVQPADVTEQTAFTTPSVRVRLFAMKLETPVVDFLAGQYHDLFGWGGEGFYQNSLAFLGVGGEIYHRNPQVRISRTFGGPAANLDLAVAIVRPVQRDAELPDVQAGVKLAINGWKGATAQGFGQPAILPLAIGVSGVGRRFAVAEFLTNPGDAKIGTGWGAAVNAFLPVIPARDASDRGNALSLTGEASVGTGISDLYTGLTGGMVFPLLPDPSGGQVPPPIYNANIDSGIVTYDANGNLKSIAWRSLVLGLQYYLPIAAGRVWVSATASRIESTNILELTPEASRGAIFTRQDYADGNLFWAAAPAVQLGLSFQITEQTLGDRPFGGPHLKPRNYRSELGVRFFF